MVTYAVNQTWSEQVSAKMSAASSPSFDTASPFEGFPVDLGARTLQGSPGDRGAFRTDPVSWHCLRIFFVRGPGSHQRVLAVWWSLLVLIETMLHKEAVHNTVAHCVCVCVCDLYTLLNVFVFPSFLPTQTVNEVFSTLSGERVRERWSGGSVLVWRVHLPSDALYV